MLAGVVLAGSMFAGSAETAPPTVPPEEAEVIAEEAFRDTVTAEFGSVEWVTCTLDPNFVIADIQCFGLLLGDLNTDSISRPVEAVVIQNGWIDDDGEFVSLREPTAVPVDLSGGDEAPDSAGDVDALRTEAEEYLTTYEFEVAAELWGRVENPRCETPDSTEEGETFECRFDMVTNQNTFIMQVRFRVTETGSVEAISVDFDG